MTPAVILCGPGHLFEAAAKPRSLGGFGAQSLVKDACHAYPCPPVSAPRSPLFCGLGVRGDPDPRGCLKGWGHCVGGAYRPPWLDWRRVLAACGGAHRPPCICFV